MARPAASKRLVASGGVTLRNGAEAAEAREAVYTVATGEIVMQGEVLLTQNGSAIAGRPAGRRPDHRTGVDGRPGNHRAANRAGRMTDRPELRVAGGRRGSGRIGPAQELSRQAGDPRCVDFGAARRDRRASGSERIGQDDTFYAIAGLIRPEGGSVTIDGIDATLLPMFRHARLGIGYLPQEASIFRGLSVEDNILAILELSDSDRLARKERLEDLLAEFSIGHLRRTPARALSGGERRRVEIARCAGVRTRNTCCSTSPLPGSIRSRRRHPRPGLAPVGARHRRADHRPQCARDAGDRGPRLYPA
jgi:hypothetical protein